MRLLSGRGLLLLVVLSFAGGPVWAADGGPLVSEVATLNMTVSDMDRAFNFFSRVLSFDKVSEVEVWGDDYDHLEGIFGLRMHVVKMRLGDESIERTEYLTPKGRPIPVDSRSNDRWFQHVAIIVSDIDRAYHLLRQNHVQHASTGPQRLPDWNKNAAGISAFYFKDPDGHTLEVLQLPSDKGDPKWHVRTDKLFLGIDHTAIVVADTETSLKFYRDLLGMRIAGTSENYGTEQEHLNNDFGARLRVTSLRTAKALGVELLEYLAPRDGRPIPADERADDIAHWQTEMMTTDASGAEQRLHRANIHFVSPGTVAVDPKLGFRKGLLVRDPDGHVVELTER